MTQQDWTLMKDTSLWMLFTPSDISCTPTEFTLAVLMTGKRWTYVAQSWSYTLIKAYLMLQCSMADKQSLSYGQRGETNPITTVCTFYLVSKKAIGNSFFELAASSLCWNLINPKWKHSRSYDDKTTVNIVQLLSPNHHIQQLL